MFIIGRARLFHGVNIVSFILVLSVAIYTFLKVFKSFPFHPDNGSTFDPEYSLNDEDVQFLSDNGFNVVRFYVAWPGVEPVKDQYNSTYLDVSYSCIMAYINIV